ncbi:MAG: phage portal protein [Cellulosilyticum sp.]|nr:phage portal protein [Cellulosilyticum sp.]
MGWFRKKQEIREAEVVIDDPVLKALLTTDNIDREKALNIPSLYGCIEMISNTVASIPIKIYKENGKDTEELQDYRLKLLNEETGDLLNSYQAKKALIRDFLLDGNGYLYINKKGNIVESLHYVESRYVTATKNVDPIFKSLDVRVLGEQKREFDFVALTKNTVDGFTGSGILADNQQILSVAYNSIKYENNLVRTGGNRKGFLKAKNKLTQEIIEKLKQSWRNLYSNNTENVVVLNDGLEFQEASNTCVEMQLNENKKTNSEEICKLLNMSVKVLNGTANDAEQADYIKNCIMPILKAFETALNKSLLLETEKDSGYYFAFDCKELIKGDIKKLFEAYKVAVDSNIMQIDEVRYELDLKPLEFNYIKLGLQDVLLDPKTGQVYTPNMNATANLNSTSQTKEGEEDESRD